MSGRLSDLMPRPTRAGTLTYTYDGAGHVATIQSSNTNGVNVSYSYDSQGRLGTVVDHRLSGNQTTTYAYDDASNVATVTYPNGVQTGFTYDTLNRVSALAASSGSAEVSGYTYQRDDAGKLTHVLELDNRTAAWTYDGINRLTGETVANAPGSKNGTVGYGLDPVGNRSSASSTISGLSPVSGGCPISPVVGDG